MKYIIVAAVALIAVAVALPRVSETVFYKHAAEALKYLLTGAELLYVYQKVLRYADYTEIRNWSYSNSILLTPCLIAREF